MRQHTLLNLGSDFPLERRHWPVLCARTQQLLDRQGERVPLTCPEEVEWHAQHIAAHGKLVVTLDAPSDGAIADLMHRIPDLPGVLACTLAHHHSESNLEDGA